MHANDTNQQTRSKITQTNGQRAFLVRPIPNRPLALRNPRRHQNARRSWVKSRNKNYQPSFEAGKKMAIQFFTREQRGSDARHAKSRRSVHKLRIFQPHIFSPEAWMWWDTWYLNSNWAYMEREHKEASLIARHQMYIPANSCLFPLSIRDQFSSFKYPEDGRDKLWHWLFLHFCRESWLQLSWALSLDLFSAPFSLLIIFNYRWKVPIIPSHSEMRSWFLKRHPDEACPTFFFSLSPQI